MFVGTKKQAKEIVTECAEKGQHAFRDGTLARRGMLTNFNTVRKSVKANAKH